MVSLKYESNRSTFFASLMESQESPYHFVVSNVRGDELRSRLRVLLVNESLFVPVSETWIARNVSAKQMIIRQGCGLDRKSLTANPNTWDATLRVSIQVI